MTLTIELTSEQVAQLSLLARDWLPPLEEPGEFALGAQLMNCAAIGINYELHRLGLEETCSG